jgi:hypothetical protein
MYKSVNKFIFIYRVGKKSDFFIFWNPEIYFSKNDPSRGNCMQEIDCPNPENASLTLIQGKIGFSNRNFLFFSSEEQC